MVAVFIIPTNFIIYKHLTKNREKNPTEPGRSSQERKTVVVHQQYQNPKHSPPDWHLSSALGQCQTGLDLGFMQV